MTRSRSKHQRDYELRLRAKGYQRISVWVPVADADRLRRFAHALVRTHRKTEVPLP